MEAKLAQGLVNASDGPGKVDLLLSLSNIYYYKPERKPKFIIKSIDYARQAAKISMKLNDRRKLNQAQYMVGLGLLCQYNFEAAEALVPQLNEEIKCDLLVAIGFSLTNSRVGQNEYLLPNSNRILKLALPLSLKLKNKRNELIIRQCLISTAFQNGDGEANPEQNEKIIAEYIKYNVPGISYAYYLTGEMYNWQSKNNKAMFYIQSGIRSMEKNGDIMVGGDFYRVLGIIFKHESEYTKQLESYHKSLFYFKKYPGLGDMFIAIQGVAYSLIHLKKPKEALNYLDSSLVRNQPEEFNQKRRIYEMYGNVYLALKDYTRAERYYLKKFNLEKAQNDLSFDSFDRMGYYYIESKEFAKAKPYLDSAIARINSPTSPNAIASLKYRLFLVDSAAGKYLSAINYLNSNHHFTDSVAREKKRGEINRLLVEYEDDKKKSEIKALKQRRQLDLANIKRASLVKNFSIVGALVLLVVSIIIYRQYKSKLNLTAEILLKNQRQEMLLEKLNRLLSEKEWLLKEVHHRVKNNLHTVISLLNIQAEFLKDDALLAIENSQHRIYVMSLIHQKLYASNEIQTIDMVEYVTELITYLKDSYEGQQNIEYVYQLDPLVLEVGQAMPLGLIINEAVTNSIKYAFPDRQKGTISLEMKKIGDMVVMTISDNGVGISESSRNEKLSSLGLKLIEGLSADIGAELTLENKDGTRVRITFDPEYFKTLDNV